jgi:hypothetical protein
MPRGRESQCHERLLDGKGSSNDPIGKLDRTSTYASNASWGIVGVFFKSLILRLMQAVTPCGRNRRSLKRR